MTRYGVSGIGRGRTGAGGGTREGRMRCESAAARREVVGLSRATGIAAGSFADTAAWGESLVLAVKGSGAGDVLRLAGRERLDGKVIIDTTNPIDDSPPVDGVLGCFTGPNESLMEQLQAACPAARFVKAFNSVGSALMVHPVYAGARPTMFYCGNDAGAKGQGGPAAGRLRLGACDMGTARAARAIEPLAILWCIPGFLRDEWTHAFKLLTSRTAPA